MDNCPSKNDFSNPLLKISQFINEKELTATFNETLSTYTQQEYEKLQVITDELQKFGQKLQSENETYQQDHTDLEASINWGRLSLEITYDLRIILKQENVKAELEREQLIKHNRSILNESLDKYNTIKGVYEAYDPSSKELKGLRVQNKKFNIAVKIIKHNTEEYELQLRDLRRSRRQIFHARTVKFARAMLNYRKTQSLKEQVRIAEQGETELLQEYSRLQILTGEKGRQFRQNAPKPEFTSSEKSQITASESWSVLNELNHNFFNEPLSLSNTYITPIANVQYQTNEMLNQVKVRHQQAQYEWSLKRHNSNLFKEVPKTAQSQTGTKRIAPDSRQLNEKALRTTGGKMFLPSGVKATEFSQQISQSAETYRSTTTETKKAVSRFFQVFPTMQPSLKQPNSQNTKSNAASQFPQNALPLNNEKLVDSQSKVKIMSVYTTVNPSNANVTLMNENIEKYDSQKNVSENRDLGVIFGSQGFQQHGISHAQQTKSSMQQSTFKQASLTHSQTKSQMIQQPTVETSCAQTKYQMKQLPAFEVLPRIQTESQVNQQFAFSEDYSGLEKQTGEMYSTTQPTCQIPPRGETINYPYVKNINGVNVEENMGIYASAPLSDYMNYDNADSISLTGAISPPGSLENYNETEQGTNNLNDLFGPSKSDGNNMFFTRKADGNSTKFSFNF